MMPFFLGTKIKGYFYFLLHREFLVFRTEEQNKVTQTLIFEVACMRGKELAPAVIHLHTSICNDGLPVRGAAREVTWVAGT